MAGERAEGATPVRVSLPWAVAAAASLVALYLVAPSGLYLLGFLAVVILLHEAGHLVVARRVGMQPLGFYWGFGPEIASIERNGCRYGVKALFLGGYVHLPGMTAASAVPDGIPEARTYRAARHRDRLVTILAGPGVNLATGAAAFAAASLIDGATLRQAAGAGVSDVALVATSTGAALWAWVTQLGAYAASVFDTSGATEAPVRFLSPVAQARISGAAVDSGLSTSLRWFGILSSAVGIVNLLPLPPLDGSHALISGLEGVLRRLRPRRRAVLDVAALAPLAWVTVVALVFLTVSALVLDLRDVL